VYRPAARVDGARRREVAAARIGLGCIVACLERLIDLIETALACGCVCTRQ
jgi:hypothetical protein